MKRALWAVFGVLVVSAITYYVMTHPNLEKLEHLNGELEKLRAENTALADQNAKLETEIVALRDDPRLAERRAREAAGLARPNEVIYQFAEPDVPIEVTVALVVKTDGLELAGKPVELESLKDALGELRKQLPGVRIELDVKEDVDPIRKQRVQDVVDGADVAEQTN